MGPLVQAVAEVAGTLDMFARVPQVLWRLGDDRVIVVRVGGSRPRLTADLTGATAVAWLALDRPRPLSGLIAQLATAGSDDARERTVDAVTELLAAGLIKRQVPVAI